MKNRNGLSKRDESNSVIKKKEIVNELCICFRKKKQLRKDKKKVSTDGTECDEMKDEKIK